MLYVAARVKHIRRRRDHSRFPSHSLLLGNLREKGMKAVMNDSARELGHQFA